MTVAWYFTVTVSPEQYNVTTVIRKFNELLVAFLIVSIFNRPGVAGAVL